MTEEAVAAPNLTKLARGPQALSEEESRRHTAKRYAKERRFRMLGLGAICIAIGLLGILLSSIVLKGYTAFVQTYITLDVALPAEEIDPDGTGDPKVIGGANFQRILYEALFEQFPEVESRSERRGLTKLISSGAGLMLREQVMENPGLIGTTLSFAAVASDDIDQLVKGNISREVEEANRRVSDAEIAWLDRLDEEGSVSRSFNTLLFTQGDSREPELAGIWGAAVGSFYLMVVTLSLSAPLGIAAAVYLEEFATRNRLTDIIEVNINNLAAVPSIVYGLLGLAVFLNVFHLPRSAPIVGGLTLTLMTLPTIVVATRAALRAVPPSIRQAALGIGASRVQTVWHHTLPLAAPGVLTGTIIGMAQALGETAPLLMIGMVAFIVSVPSGPFDAATALPVQIYLWADSPERAFVERTSAAIMVLLGFLICMNAIAVFLRRRFERQW